MGTVLIVAGASWVVFRVLNIKVNNTTDGISFSIIFFAAFMFVLSGISFCTGRPEKELTVLRSQLDQPALDALLAREANESKMLMVYCVTIIVVGLAVLSQAYKREDKLEKERQHRRSASNYTYTAPEARVASPIVPALSVEQKAMQTVMAFERNMRYPRDVSASALGYDIESSYDGDIRYIEVKGLAPSLSSAEYILLTKHEYDRARELGSRYWLYVVVGCGEARQNLLILQNPIQQISPQFDHNTNRYRMLISDIKRFATIV